MSIDWHTPGLQRRAAEGVARVMPVQPQADPPPGEAQPPHPDPTPPAKQRLFEPHTFGIATTTNRVFQLGNQPDYWHVYLDGTANSEVSVFEGQQTAGEALAIIGPRGYARIPANSDTITLVSSGAATARGQVVACAGLDYETKYGS